MAADTPVSQQEVAYRKWLQEVIGGSIHAAVPSITLWQIAFGDIHNYISLQGACTGNQIETGWYHACMQ